MNLKGSLPLLILHILSFGPNHGYQIAKLIRIWSNTELDFREGTLYPTLHNMAEQDMIAVLEESSAGRKKRRYVLTELGQKQLEANRDEWQTFADAVNRVLSSSPDSDAQT